MIITVKVFAAGKEHLGSRLEILPGIHVLALTPHSWWTSSNQRKDFNYLWVLMWAHHQMPVVVDSTWTSYFMAHVLFALTTFITMAMWSNLHHQTQTFGTSKMCMYSVFLSSYKRTSGTRPEQVEEVSTYRGERINEPEICMGYKLTDCCITVPAGSIPRPTSSFGYVYKQLLTYGGKRCIA